MTQDQKIARHAALVERMGDAVGVDLTEAVQRGDLSPEEALDSVTACLGCSQTDACEHWLAAKEGRDAIAPEYCRNRELFQALKV